MKIRTHFRNLEEVVRWTRLPFFIIWHEGNTLVREEHDQKLMVFTQEEGGVYQQEGIQGDWESAGMSEDSFFLWINTEPDLQNLVERYYSLHSSGVPYFGCANIDSLGRRLGNLQTILFNRRYREITPLNRLRAYAYFFSLQLEMEKAEGAILHGRGLNKTPPGLNRKPGTVGIDYVNAAHQPTATLKVEYKVTIHSLTHAIAALLEEGKAVTRDSALENLRSLLYRRGESFCGQDSWHYLPAEKQWRYEKALALANSLFPEFAELKGEQEPVAA